MAKKTVENKKQSFIRNKYFLYATEFFSGMSVMAIELGASRLLAPYFSSSQIVWTIIIGTIMIAMALGNVIGGQLADKNPDPSRLYSRLLIAAVWTAAIPFAGKYVIAGISLLLATVVTKNFLIWASFISCLALFVFPLLLLGTVTPSLARYTMERLDDSGKIVGRLGALNTIGSIIGTFVPTFITIPAVGTAITFIIFASILLILCLIYFISAKKSLIKCAISTVLITILTFTSVTYQFAFWENNIIFEGESIYNYLQVRETDTQIILSTNVLAGVQSITMKNGALTGMYYDYALAAPLMLDKDYTKQKDILILGMGTGTYATQCMKYLKNVQIEGVEIDKKIVDLSRQYFNLSDTIPVSIDDGRAYLSTDKTYDVIMVDAYQDITIPFQMSTIEFFTLVKEHLNENGVMVVNLNMYSDTEGSINEYLMDTISNVFSNVWKIKVPNTTNMELFASDSNSAISNLETNAVTLSDIQLFNMMLTVSDNLEKIPRGTKILTDDKAPVELLGMKMLDEIIEKELAYYKSFIMSGDLFDLFQPNHSQ